MKIRPYFKSFHSVAIGLATLFTTAPPLQAADIGAPVLEDWHPGTATSRPQASSRTEGQSATPLNQSLDARGAEGPIRTESGDQVAKADREALNRDFQMKRYPISREAGIP